MARISAVVLAGGKLSPEMAQAAGVDARVDVCVGERSMFATVVDALGTASGIGSVVVVGSCPPSDSYTQVPDSGGFVDNLYAGLSACPESPRVLIATADLPFLSAEGVDDLLNLAASHPADIVYPIVEVALCYARYPGLKRTAVSTREGRFTGSNLIVADRAFLLRQRPRIEAAYRARKRPARLAAMLGANALARFALSRIVGPGVLSIAHLEAGAARLIQGTARAPVSRYPEIATDVDRPGDLAAARLLTAAAVRH